MYAYAMHVQRLRCEMRFARPSKKKERERENFSQS
jgi:hypothetical protein